MAEIKSITIAGGGLAGLTLALALRQRDIPVTVHEAGTYPRHRVCGEFLSGDGEKVLNELGVGDVLNDAPVQRSTAWFHRDRAIYAAALPKSARGISRFALDARLCRKLQARGGRLEERSRLQPTAGEGSVWCGGRIPVKSAWIGLKCHVNDLPLAADLEMHLGSKGYLGLATIEDGRVNACGLFRCEPGLGGKLPAYLRGSGLGSLAERMEAAGIEESSCVAVAGFRPGWQRELPGSLTVGDASGMIPPFAGNGMSMAFEAAAEAAGPLADYAEGMLSWAAACARVRHKLRRRFARRLGTARALHPFLTETLGQSVLAALARLHLLPFGPAFRLLR